MLFKRIIYISIEICIFSKNFNFKIIFIKLNLFYYILFTTSPTSFISIFLNFRNILKYNFSEYSITS